MFQNKVNIFKINLRKTELQCYFEFKRNKTQSDSFKIDSRNIEHIGYDKIEFEQSIEQIQKFIDKKTLISLKEALNILCKDNSHIEYTIKYKPFLLIDILLVVNLFIDNEESEVGDILEHIMSLYMIILNAEDREIRELSHIAPEKIILFLELSLNFLKCKYDDLKEVILCASLQIIYSIKSIDKLRKYSFSFLEHLRTCKFLKHQTSLFICYIDIFILINEFINVKVEFQTTKLILIMIDEMNYQKNIDVSSLLAFIKHVLCNLKNDNLNAIAISATINLHRKRAIAKKDLFEILLLLSKKNNNNFNGIDNEIFHYVGYVLKNCEFRTENMELIVRSLINLNLNDIRNFALYKALFDKFIISLNSSRYNEFLIILDLISTLIRNINCISFFMYLYEFDYELIYIIFNDCLQNTYLVYEKNDDKLMLFVYLICENIASLCLRQESIQLIKLLNTKQKELASSLTNSKELVTGSESIIKKDKIIARFLSIEKIIAESDFDEIYEVIKKFDYIKE